ncbi:helix-turn-helix domain-containing protein [Clostridium butyricum]
MIKDLLSSFKAILNDINMSKNEKLVLECLILNYNVNMGYAFPKYEQLKIALSTKRDETVSNTLKSLVDKGYININKAGRKNVYYINRYLYLITNGNNKSIKTNINTYSKRNDVLQECSNLKEKDIKVIEDGALKSGGVININISI